MANYVKRYIPKVVEGNDTLDALYTVEAEEIGAIHNAVDSLINNTYISSSDLSGIQKWEELLKLKPNSDNTLEERREILLDEILYRPPFTRQRLDDILKNIWGAGNYLFTIYPSEYKIIIDINTSNPTIYLKFSNKVRNIIPANIQLVFAIQYTYLYLNRNMTYERMGQQFTYYELSRYA